MKPGGKKTLMSARLPAGLWRSVKMQCALRDIKLQVAIVEALTQWLGTCAHDIRVEKKARG